MHKWCFVPLCTNTGRNNPNKVFFNIPRDRTTRISWYKAARRGCPQTAFSINEMYCCEDHFELSTDMENFTRFSLMRDTEYCPKRLLLKKGVLPSIFSCQNRNDNGCSPLDWNSTSRNGGPFIMTEKRTGSGENEAQPKLTNRTTIEPDSDECDIKIEPFEDYDALLSCDFDVLHTNDANHIAESVGVLDSLTRNTSGIAHQNSGKRLATENLPKNPSVQIDDSLNSAQINVEMKASRKSKDLSECNPCSNRADKLSVVTNHSLSHSNKNPACVKILPFKSGCTTVSEPNVSYTTENGLFCTFCSYTTSRRVNLKQHILTHAVEKPFSCELCSFRTTRKDTLNGHILTHTGEKPFSCELCSFKTNRKGTLNRHILTHTGEKPFLCEFCSFKTTQKNFLNRHIFTHTLRKPFSCEFCSFKTTLKGSWNQHLLTHSGEKPFSCEICSFKTTRNDVLKVHILSHTGEKPFSCELCSFKTAYKNSLKVHILTHTEKPFSCELCSFKTTLKDTLNCHIFTHTGEKPFSCEICSFKTTRKDALNLHILAHTGEKPFACNICSFKTFRKNSLNVHISAHTGEKPFSCMLCSYKTNHKGSLIRHISNHAGAKPFSPDICSFKASHMNTF